MHEEYIENWNDAFDIFKICQSYRAYNLGWNINLTYREDRQGGHADINDDNVNEGYFACKDDAGYERQSMHEIKDQDYNGDC